MQLQFIFILHKEILCNISISMNIFSEFHSSGLRIKMNTQYFASTPQTCELKYAVFSFEYGKNLRNQSVTYLPQ